MSSRQEYTNGGGSFGGSSSSSSAPRALTTFLSQVEQAASSSADALANASSSSSAGDARMGSRLAKCFDLSDQDARVLAQAIQHISSSKLQSLTTQGLKQAVPTSSYTGERFAGFVAEYLVWLQQLASSAAATRGSPSAPISPKLAIAFLRQQNQSNSQSSGGKPADGEVWEKVYDAWAQLYAKAAVVFQQQDTAWFSETLCFIGRIMVNLAIQVDTYGLAGKLPRTTDAAGRLSKSAGSAGNDRQPAPCLQTKRNAVLALANASFKAYFKLNNIRLCSTVLGSVENAFTLNRQNADAGNKSTSRESAGRLSGEESYTRSERVTYHYYVGRLRLSQHRIRLAYNELRWAFDNCSSASYYNLRQIATPLTACGMILGVFPSALVLQEIGLWAQYGPVMEAFKKGNGAAMFAALDANREWFRARGLYLLMKDKLQVGCWRCLIKQALLIHRARTPSSISATGAAPPPTLPLGILLSMARLAWHDADLTLLDVESIVASLISQGYIKAYIMQSKGLIVFQKGDRMGLVAMNEVYAKDA